jgi:conjugal transfer mating pair stabilization protein TraG
MGVISAAVPVKTAGATATEFGTGGAEQILTNLGEAQTGVLDTDPFEGATAAAIMEGLGGASSQTVVATGTAVGDTFSKNADTTKPTSKDSSTDISVSDRDTLIRTVIGEAAGEGELGQAAVAHVILNRAMDGNFPGKNSITGVAKLTNNFLLGMTKV